MRGLMRLAGARPVVQLRDRPGRHAPIRAELRRNGDRWYLGLILNRGCTTLKKEATDALTAMIREELPRSIEVSLPIAGHARVLLPASSDYVDDTRRSWQSVLVPAVGGIVVRIDP